MKDCETIAIKQETFLRLQKHATPLVDTVDNVIARALDALEYFDVDSGRRQVRTPAVEHLLKSSNLPDLRYSKLISAKIDGLNVNRTNWKNLLDYSLILLTKKVSGYEDIQSISKIRMHKGMCVEHGFYYLSDIDISIQGMSAIDTCRAIIRICEYIDTDYDILLEWGAKAKNYPGQCGRIISVMYKK